MKQYVLTFLSLILVVGCVFVIGCSNTGDKNGTASESETETDVPEVSPKDADGKFTIAILPDTQQEVTVEHAINQKYFAQRNEWLVSVKEERDIRFAVHTGDVVNWGNAEERQYVMASEAMAILDNAGIPVVYSLGNHDTAAVGVGGGAAVPSQTTTLVRDTALFNKYFSTKRYPYLTVKDEGKVDNSYATFEECGVKWLVLSLELWPRVEAIEWAKGVVEDHPDYNVIVSTHCYIHISGGISDSNGGYGATAPTYLFDQLISKYENIKMVFCGHVGQSLYRTDKGVNGNKIVSILGCFHSNEVNPVRLLEVDVKNGKLKGEIHIPINGQRWKHFDFTMTGMKFIGAE